MAESLGIHTTSQLENPEERKIQRRSRVRVKLEDARRLALGIKPETPPKDNKDPEKERISSQQILKSKERLKKLVSDGHQLVTGVAVAGDAREVIRRQEEQEGRKGRYEKMEAEANASSERFEEIMRKWTHLESKKVPQHTQDLIQQQKNSCEEMLDEKNKLIGEFEEELKMKDDQYVKHLKKQAEDIDLLTERMEEQARSIVKAFHEELEEIDKAFTSERQQLVESHLKNTEETSKTRREKESEYLEIREKRIEENEAKIQHLRMRNAEEFNEIKIKLETDIQHLQQQIQQMKATFQLNAEKLEYNFQVLKKRDEENMVTISQQKRKLTRLQDTLNNLRIKLAKQVKNNKDEIESLMAEYKKNVEQYKELQKKFKHFQLVDAKRFYDIWQMNEDKVRSLANDVAHADQIIHGQQLGLEWQQPAPIDSPLQPFLTKMTQDVSHATMYASQVLSESESDAALQEVTTVITTSAITDGSLPFSVKKQILEIIADEGSFLLESKLTHLLAPLDKEEKMLMKLDSIFKALGVTSQKDVEDLMKFFVKEKPQEPEELDSRPLTSVSSSVSTEPSSTIIIHPNDVPHALKVFTESRQAQPSSSTDSSRLKLLGLHGTGVTTEILESSFWTSVASSLPKSHEKLWTALEDGLDKYHTVLSSRSKLINETESLRQQNGELRLLLHQYMQSRVNQELEVPPTLMMPMAIDSTTVY